MSRKGCDVSTVPKIPAAILVNAVHGFRIKIKELKHEMAEQSYCCERLLRRKNIAEASGLLTYIESQIIQCSLSLGGHGSLPGGMVSLLLILPSSPLIASSPPP